MGAASWEAPSGYGSASIAAGRWDPGDPLPPQQLLKDLSSVSAPRGTPGEFCVRLVTQASHIGVLGTIPTSVSYPSSCLYTLKTLDHGLKTCFFATCERDPDGVLGS